MALQCCNVWEKSSSFENGMWSTVEEVHMVLYEKLMEKYDEKFSMTYMATRISYFSIFLTLATLQILDFKKVIDQLG